MNPGDKRIVVGAPVAARDWILPRYIACLANQTRPPNEFCFVFSPAKNDNTYRLIHDLPRGFGIPVTVSEYKASFWPRAERNTNPADKHRAAHFSRLRNQLRQMFLRTSADVFCSIDTDILLEDRSALERLLEPLDDGWDVSCALTYLHPLEAASGCYNAGIWGGGDIGSYDRIWARADRVLVEAHQPPVPIDIPMACYAMHRHVLEHCNYKPHECGEDLGFADNLWQQHFRIAWCTDIEVRHVWGPSYLEESNGTNTHHIPAGVRQTW